ncbi:hypothetical protein [uncultured Algoriphagus sp.]|uniref:hypothetical protein n=1 Tax=uncultured Algoriphagus sp. TaxID=417365 RepID=UPI002586942A|nr:hypothetical protein [uncultured Algoriphagus sp.]
MYIELQDIFDATDGGLNIITDYFPDARKAVERKGTKFSIRPEKTPSCTLKQLSDGNWVLTDFGDDSKPKNGLMICMEQEGLGYGEAIQFLAEKYGLSATSEKYKAPEPVITDRDAEANENDGEWYFEVRDGFTEFEAKTVLSKYVIPQKKTEEGKKVIDLDKVKEVFRKFNFYALLNYKIVKNRKVTIIEATDDYPIFMWDEGPKMKKIYQPLTKDKGFRFMYYGKLEKDYLFGLTQVAREYAKIEEAYDADELDEEGNPIDKKKPKKLPHVIYCTGGSDAMNLAFLGHQVCWGNSETAKLTWSQWRSLSDKAEKVMQCPDLDTTGIREGHRLALEYMDLFTIKLPEELKSFKDRRGNPCKDVRDYLNHFNNYHFEKLVKTALPYRFWEMEAKFDRKGEYKGMGYAADPVQLYNFLQANGFCQFEAEGEKSGTMYVHIQDNIVEETRAGKVKNWIHKFLQDHYYPKELRNIFYRTPLLSDQSLSNLPVIDLDMKTYGPDHQLFFFNNKIIRVSSKEIQEFKPGQIQQYVWRDEVIDHHLKIQTEHFKVTDNPEHGYEIEILKKDNKFLNYLINTSRIHWRRELEDTLDHLPVDQAEAYRQAHKFDIAGPNLTIEEQREQMKHLVNKIYALGYLLHRYKDASRPWAVFAMDNRVGDEGESNGGSGKSICFNSVSRFMKSHYLSGRDPKLTDKPHIYEGITKHTFFVLVDDAHQYLNFHFFFDVITGKMAVNPKNTRQYVLDFPDVPKFAFTSNFAVRNLDGSALRRILYTVFSDYYHHSKEGFYREHRTPEDDFGKKLLDDDYTREEWNDFYNFMIQCCHFYLQHDKIEPPMSNVEKRNLLGVMGDEFKDWADVYFSPESGRLNNLEIKQAAFDDFKSQNKTLMKAQRFTKALHAWVKFMGYRLNPDHLGLKNADGRIIQKGEYHGEHKTLEYIWIQPGNDPVQAPGSPPEVRASEGQKSILDDLSDSDIEASF